MKIELVVESDGRSAELIVGNNVIGVCSKKDVVEALQSFEIGEGEEQILQEDFNTFMRTLKDCALPDS